jgi:hypothetical protein
MGKNVKITIRGEMSKLMYEGECENYYTKRDMKINVCWGM